MCAYLRFIMFIPPMLTLLLLCTSLYIIYIISVHKLNMPIETQGPILCILCNHHDFGSRTKTDSFILFDYHSTHVSLIVQFMYQS